MLESLNSNTKKIDRDGKTEPQFMMRLSTSRHTTTESKSVAYYVESENHGLFEVRFHRLAHVDESA